MTPCPPDLSTAVYGLVGAAVGLGGLMLVFSGLLYARAASFAPATDDAIIERYKSAARFASTPFILSLLVAEMGAGYSWMPESWHHLVGFMTLYSFCIVLLATAIYAYFAVRLL